MGAKPVFASVFYLILVLCSSAFGDEQANLPALVSPCMQAVTMDSSLLRTVLGRTNGFGSTYLTDGKKRHMVLSKEDIQYFKRITNKRSKDHHFIFSDIELTAAGEGTEPYSIRGQTGVRHYFNFQKKIDENTLVVAQLNETRVGGKTTSFVLLGFASAADGGEIKWSKMKLGHTGISSWSELDEDNFEHFRGHQFGYSTYKFITIHVPEEVEPGNRNWEPTGSGNFSIDFFRDTANNVSAKLSGYAAKR